METTDVNILVDSIIIHISTQKLKKIFLLIWHAIAPHYLAFMKNGDQTHEKHFFRAL